MIDPNHPDPYVDEVPHDPGEKVPTPEPEREAPSSLWPEPSPNTESAEVK